MTFLGQVIHVFRKDVRRAAPLLGGLALLMIWYTTVGLPESRWLGQRTGILPSALGLFPLVYLVLAALIVQDDPPASDLAFWPTKPIGAMPLLASKLLTLSLLVVVIPAAVNATYIGRAVTGESVLPLFVGSLEGQATFIIPIALLAALTRSFRGFVTVGILGWLGMTAVISWSSAVPTYDPAIRSIREAALGIGAAVLALGLLGYQYGWRRTRRTAALGALGFLALSITVYRTDVILPEPDPGPPLEELREVEADLYLLGMQAEQMDGDDPKLVRYQGQLDTYAVAPGARVRRTKATIEGEGRTWTYDLAPRPFELRSQPVYALGLLDVEGIPWAGIREDYRRPPTSLAGLLAEGEEDQLHESLGGGERLQLAMEVELFEPRIQARMPAEVGATTRVGNQVFTVTQLVRNDRGLRVGFSNHRVLTRGTRFRPQWEGAQPVLYNLRYGELHPADGRGAQRSDQEILGVARGPSLHQEHFDYVFAVVPMESRWRDPLPDDWFDDIEIVFVDTELVETVLIRSEHTVARWPSFERYVRLEERPRRPPAQPTTR